MYHRKGENCIVYNTLGRISLFYSQKYLFRFNFFFFLILSCIILLLFISNRPLFILQPDGAGSYFGGIWRFSSLCSHCLLLSLKQSVTLCNRTFYGVFIEFFILNYFTLLVSTGYLEMAAGDVDQRIRDIQREYADFLDDYV